MAGRVERPQRRHAAPHRAAARAHAHTASAGVPALLQQHRRQNRLQGRQTAAHGASLCPLRHQLERASQTTSELINCCHALPCSALPPSLFIAGHHRPMAPGDRDRLGRRPRAGENSVRQMVGEIRRVDRCRIVQIAAARTIHAADVPARGGAGDTRRAHGGCAAWGGRRIDIQRGFLVGRRDRGVDRALPGVVVDRGPLPHAPVAETRLRHRRPEGGRQLPLPQRLPPGLRRRRPPRAGARELHEVHRGGERILPKLHCGGVIRTVHRKNEGEQTHARAGPVRA